ncbi:MAG TPA: hypothetical protein VGI92_14375 [Gemmatimonadales bacterium]|jgi:hypothetical protein
MMVRAQPVLALAGALALTPPLFAQSPGLVESLVPVRHWFVTASVGLVRREDGPWVGIHDGLSPSGWDANYAVICELFCEAPSDVAEGRPLAFTVAVRRRLHRRWQIRISGDRAPLGTYPGLYGTTVLAVKPTVTSAGAQAVYAWRFGWLGLGPSINVARVTERADPSAQAAQRTMAGAIFAGGVVIPERGPVFVEGSFERRFTGRVSTPAMPVSGLPLVPALSVPVTHTVLNVAIGIRL